MTAIEEMQVTTKKETQILEVAERLFATKGFEGASVREIARDADVSVSMISYYFGSKEKLMEAIVLKRLGLVKLRLEHLLEDFRLSSLQKMYAVVDSNVEDIIERQYFQKIMIREQCGKSSTTTARLIEDNRKDIGELMRKLISEGQRKGEFRGDVDITLLMMTLIGTTNYIMAAEKHYRVEHDMMHTGKQEFQKFVTLHVSNYIKDIFRHVLCD
ncbi:MAG: TetR family transcriptional regulator [Flavipsychrobacter sp.]|nr:TetR family transcriptional regulator [Flavipsychrobacter sp.]